MSDARLVQAQEAMEAGRFQDALTLLKGILQERPDDMEVRNLLMECQAGMMLQLQVNEKLKKAGVLLEQGLRENAEKILHEILKADPGNREALALLQPSEPVQDDDATASFETGGADLLPDLELPALQDMGPTDATATDDFSVGALPSFGEMPSLGFPTAVGELPELTPLESIDLAPSSSFAAEATVLSGSGPGSAEQAKIRQYIEEGRELQSQGRTQEAVDTWTRVFILDEENQEVQGLIDAARASMSGNQGEIEHALAEGIAAFNSGQPQRARPLLEKVLQAFPGHKEAQYYLDRMQAAAPAPSPSASASGGMGFELDTGFDASPPAPTLPTPQPVTFGTHSQAFAPPPPPPVTPAAGPDEFEFDTASDAGGPFSAPPPPPPTPAAAVPPVPLSPGLAPEPPPPPAFEPGPLPFSGPGAEAKKKEARAAGGGPNLKLILGGAAAVLVVAVGIFVAMKFLGDDDKDAAPVIPVERRQANTPGAGAEAGTPEGTRTAPPPGQLVTAADFIREARSAMEVREYARATSYYQQALLREKDNGEAQAGLDQARQLAVKQEQEEARNQKFIKEYTFAVNAYRDGEYKESLTVAWRLIYPDDQLAQDLGKADAVRRILRDGYYNWAVQDLKIGNAKDAEKNLGEALTIDAGDAGAKNLLQFARKYADDQPDALYWETVKSLAPRPFVERP